MKKKNGFIATSLIYSFFLVFITLFFTIIADYLQNKVYLNRLEEELKETINNSKYITDFIDGSDVLTIQWASVPAGKIKCGNSLNNVSLSLSNCGTIDPLVQYKVIRKENYNSSKINTLVLESLSDGNILYLVIDNVKFSIQKDFGLTITGVS